MGIRRKRWKVYIKLPDVRWGKTHKPVKLEVTEFTFETTGYIPSVAIARAWRHLMKIPELSGMELHKVFISVEALGKYTQAQERAESAGETGTVEEETDGVHTTRH